MIKKLIALSAVSLSLLVGGCAFLEERPQTISLVFQYATLKYIGNNVDKAQRVLDVATELQEVVDGNESVTAALIQASLMRAVKWDQMDAADRLLAQEFINYGVEEVNKLVNAGQIDGSSLTTVSRVIDGVIRAAGIAAANNSV